MKKRVKIAFNAPIVLGFAFFSFWATVSGILTGNRSTRILFMTYHSSLKNPMTYLRFFTHVFGHSGWQHLMANLGYLLLVGPMLEEKYGGKVLAEVMIMTALATGLVNYFFFPEVGLCGASGVVFAFIVLASFTEFKKGEIPLTFLLVSFIFIGQQVYDGFAVTDNISNMAHIVGGLIGAVMGYGLNRNSRG